MFGLHLTLEGYKCDKKKLGDLGHCYNVLDQYPDVIKMTKIMPPHVQQDLEPPHPKWGISGVVIIAESHIAFHTFPEDGFIALDIFSCKDFDINIAIDFISKSFDVKEFNHSIFERGEHYPRSKEENEKIMQSARNKLEMVIGK